MRVREGRGGGVGVRPTLRGRARALERRVRMRGRASRALDRRARVEGRFAICREPGLVSTGNCHRSSADWSLRVGIRRGCRLADFLGTLEECQFSGNSRPQVVITRIAMPHEHHLEPRLVERRSRRRRRSPSTSSPRTTMGTETRRSQGRCRRFGDLGRLYASVAEMEGSVNVKRTSRGTTGVKWRPSTDTFASRPPLHPVLACPIRGRGSLPLHALLRRIVFLMSTTLAYSRPRLGRQIVDICPARSSVFSSSPWSSAGGSTTTTSPRRQRRTSRGDHGDDENTEDLGPRPAVRQRRRDGGIGKRR